MTDQFGGDPNTATKPGGVGAKLRGLAQLIARNPLRSVQCAFFALIAIVILQNLETTSIDVLFWTITAMPKLVLMFLAMLVGAAAWEVIRRLKL